MTEQTETVAILRDLIAFATVSSESNLELAAYLAARLEDAGARVETLPDAEGRKANIFATLGPESDGGIVLSGHTDVVPVDGQHWSSDPFVMREAEGRLYGRGACDMKGFVASAIALAGTCRGAELRRPLHFAFTYDEEVGCLGAKSLAAELQARGFAPQLAIIGEPTGMEMVEGHKGCHEYRTVVTGLEGHGSAPDLGVNAVEYAARFAARLMQLHAEFRAAPPPDSRFDPPWTTLNIGRISGGVAANVIANRAELCWDFRPVRPEDTAYLHEVLRRFVETELLPPMHAVSPEAGIETTPLGEVDGLKPMPQNDALELLAEITGENAAGLVAFGTEAGIFQSLGMAAAICGPGSIEQAHKADEFVTRDQLARCDKMLARLREKLVAN